MVVQTILCSHEIYGSSFLCLEYSSQFFEYVSKFTEMLAVSLLCYAEVLNSVYYCSTVLLVMTINSSAAGGAQI